MTSNSTNKVTYIEGKLYYSLDSLSYRISDYGYVYLIPVTCGFGILTNIFTIIVLTKGSLKGIIYKYMLFMSIFEIIEMVLNFFLMIVRCGTLCSYGYEFLSKVYEQYFFYIYITSVCFIVTSQTYT